MSDYEFKLLEKYLEGTDQNFKLAYMLTYAAFKGSMNLPSDPQNIATLLEENFVMIERKLTAKTKEYRG